MTIGTGEVKFSDIATELGVTTANFSLADNSAKCWKGGITAYASFPEAKAYGVLAKNFHSVPVAAQGSGNAGLNTTPYSISEWKGYDHGTNPAGVAGGATVSDPVTTLGKRDGQAISFFHANYNQVDTDSDIGQTFNYMRSELGCEIWAEKNGSTLSIKIQRMNAGYSQGMRNPDAMNLKVNDNTGNAHTPTQWLSGASPEIKTVMTISDLPSVVACSVEAVNTLYSNVTCGITPSGGVVTATVGTRTSANGSGVTSTSNLGTGGNVRVGYDIEVGGIFAVPEQNNTEACEKNLEIVFVFTCANSAGTTMNSHKLYVQTDWHADCDWEEPDED